MRSDLREDLAQGASTHDSVHKVQSHSVVRRLLYAMLREPPGVLPEDVSKHASPENRIIVREERSIQYFVRRSVARRQIDADRGEISGLNDLTGIDPLVHIETRRAGSTADDRRPQETIGSPNLWQMRRMDMQEFERFGPQQRGRDYSPARVKDRGR